MSKILLILIAGLLGIPGYGQEYFNNRFEFEKAGWWDGATNVCLLPDGYVIGGGTENFDNSLRLEFYKIDLQGNFLFFKSYWDSVSYYYLGNPGSIIQLSSDSLLSVGTKQVITSSGVHDQGLLYFFNSYFDTLSTKRFGESAEPFDTIYIFHQLKVDLLNNILISGTKLVNSYIKKILLIKTDLQGNQIWEKTYTDISNFHCMGHSVICTSDGGYAIGGIRFYMMGSVNTSHDPIVLKTDSSGNQLWKKAFGGGYSDTRGMICNTQDGNMVLAYAYCDYMTGSNSFRRINLIKLDNAGNVIWDKKYGTIEPENTLLNIRENADGSLVFTGTVIKEFTTKYKFFGWIMKVTSSGDSLWYRRYDICEGEGSSHCLYDVIQTADNGYIACGVVYPQAPDTGSQDGWIIKVDSLGCVNPGDCWVGIRAVPVTENGGMSVFPNPASDKVRVQLGMRNEESGMNEELKMVVHDIFGRIVEEIKVPAGKEEITLDVSGWQRGMYVFRLMYNKQQVGDQKVVVTE